MVTRNSCRVHLFAQANTYKHKINQKSIRKADEEHLPNIHEVLGSNPQKEGACGGKGAQRGTAVTLALGDRPRGSRVQG